MPTYILPDLGVNASPVGLLVYEAGQVPFLGPAIIIMIFLTITIAGSMRAKRESGASETIAWIAIGSFISSTIAIILFFIPGIINTVTLVISIAVTISSVLLLLLSNIFDD
jgi:hypothetical protein